MLILAFAIPLVRAGFSRREKENELVAERQREKKQVIQMEMPIRGAERKR